MVPVSRTFVFALLAGFALLAAGCESKNKGKIVGKWRVTNGDVPANLGPDAGMFFEFTADGTFRAYAALGGQTIERTKGKYSLGTGDTVNLSDLSPALDGKTKSREKITINGDNMTIAGTPTLTLTRAK